jgi:predicted nucleic acid-binding protein
MNGNSYLLDTNILIYLSSGDTTVAEFLENKNIFISFITELELLSFSQLHLKPEEQKKIKSLILDATVVDISQEIKKITIDLKTTSNLKLPDAIIAATAKAFNLPLFTADKHFQQIKTIDILLYQLPER